MEVKASDDVVKSNLKSWMIVISIAVLFLLWGLFIYSAVGDKEPPQWDFGAVQDIPGQSPYATANEKGLPGLHPSPLQAGEVQKQHVEGRTSQMEEPVKKGEQ